MRHGPITAASAVLTLLVAAVAGSCGSQVCRDDRDCSDNERCASDSLTCQTYRALGQYCYADDECAPHLLCNDSFEYPECHAGDYGEPCADSGDCADLLRCNHATDSPTCLPGDAGSACAEDVDCAPPLRCNDLYWPPQCEPGEADSVCFLDDDCAPPLRCNHATKPPRCRPTSLAGQPCGSDNDCAELVNGVGCNHAYNPPICAAPADVGGPCAEHADCLSGLTCTGGTLGKLACEEGPSAP